MRRRDFLKGLLAVVAIPTAVASGLLKGTPVREIPIWSTRVSAEARTLLRKYRQPLYDDESDLESIGLTVTLFTRRRQNGE